MHDPMHNKPAEPVRAEYDEPFAGFLASHFTLQQRARLLLLRGRVQDAKMGHGSLIDDLPAA